MQDNELLNDDVNVNDDTENTESVENAESEDIYVNLTDIDGVEHSYQLLTLFNAGNMNRTYGALLTQDVVLYRYFLRDGQECGEEIAEADFPPVSAHWGAVAEKLDISLVREGSLSLFDTEANCYVPCSGSILSVFTTPFGGEFVAFVPHAVHFYRYEEVEKEDGSYEVSWQSIFSTHEYDDVLSVFQTLLEE